MNITINSISFTTDPFFSGNNLIDEVIIIQANIFINNINIKGEYQFDAKLFDNPTITDFENAIIDLYKER